MKTRNDMTMIRAAGKAEKVAQAVLKGQGVKLPKAKNDNKPIQTPYLQH